MADEISPPEERDPLGRALEVEPLTEPEARPLVDLSSVERDPNSLIMGEPRFVTQAQKDEAKRIAEESEISLPEAAELSWELDSSLHALARLDEKRWKDFQPDENFLLDVPQLRELMKDVPEEEHELLAGNLQWSQSADEAQWMVEQYKTELEKEQKLAGKGWAGVGIRLGVNVFDPGAIALSMASGPVAAGHKLTRLQRALRMAGVAGTENLALQQLVSSASQTNSADDALYAFFGGAIMGGAVGGLTKGLSRAETRALREASERMLDQLDRKALRDAGVPVSEELPPARATTRPDLEEVELGGKPDGEPVKTVRQHLEEDAEPHLNDLEVRAKAIDEQAASLARQLEPKEAALRVLQAVVRSGEARKVSKESDVTVRTVPKELSRAAMEKYSPEVRAMIDAHMVDEGRVNRKMMKELEHDVEVLKKEVTGLSRKAKTMAGIGRVRSAKAALKQAEEAKAAGVPDSDRSVGAAQVRLDELRQEFLKTEGMDRSLLDEIANAPETRFANYRWDIMSTVKSSKNPFVRWIGGRMAEDPVANVDNSALEIGATEIQRHLQMVMEARFYREATPAFNAWASEKKLGLLDKMKQRRAFFEEVGHAIREGGGQDANVNKAANVLRGIFADFLVQAKEARVAGFTDVNFNSNYLPRIGASDQIRRFDAIYGTGQVADKLIKRAIMEAQPDIDEAIAAKIANGYWNRFRKIAAGQGIADLNPRGLSLDNQTLIREILEEGNLPNDEIQTVLDALARVGKNQDAAGAPARAKTRMLLDEEFEADLRHGPVSDTPGQVDRVKFSDLLENNAERLFQQYTRQLSGYIALAKKFDRFLEPGEQFSKSTFDRAVKRAEQWAGDNGMDKTETAREIENLDFLWKAVTGAPLEADPMSTFSTVTRRIRDYNFIRVMGQVGFAQVAEFGNVLAMGGIRNVIRHLPEARAMFKRAADGRLEDPLARELEELFGTGTEWIRNVAVTRWDEMHYRLPSHTAAGKALDAGLDVGRRFTAVASGMVPVNTIMQRITLKAIAQKFVNHANGVALMSEKRLRSLGLDDAMMKRVVAELKKASVKDGKVLRLNTEKWADKEALDAFTYAGFRLARRIVQENDIGGMAKWMNTPTAKLLFQFRSFMLGAWTKQFLYNVAMKDLQTYMAWSMSMVFGGLAYTAQTHLNAFGREDRERFLRERLKPETLALAAFQRAGASTLLPLVGESVWRLGSDKPLFMGRSTQLPSDALLGNPTFALYDTANAALKGLVRAPLSGDYEYSKQDLRALWTLAPLQNMVGVTQIGNLLGQALPNKSTE